MPHEPNGDVLGEKSGPWKEQRVRLTRTGKLLQHHLVCNFGDGWGDPARVPSWRGGGARAWGERGPAGGGCSHFRECPRSATSCSRPGQLRACGKPLGLSPGPPASASGVSTTVAGEPPTSWPRISRDRNSRSRGARENCARFAHRLRSQGIEHGQNSASKSMHFRVASG